MRISFAKCFSTLVFLFLPIILHSEQTDAQISANSVIATPDGILLAEGDVLVQQGDIFVKAKVLEFNRATNKIKLNGITEFYDGKSISFSANEAEVTSEFSEGIISAASILLDQTIKIRADEVRLENGEISVVSGISKVTSCNECEGEDPKWHLTSSSAKRDVENSNIVYKNVTIRVKGLPIAYIPYLRMPDPSVGRARGFLVPEAVLTSNLAIGLKLPYFIPTSLSSDILMTPYLSSKTRTLEYRYRKKFRNGDLTIKGAFSNDSLVRNELRYFSQIVGSFQLGYGIDLKFDIGKVGDTSYLGDYAYSEESDFNSEIVIGKTAVVKQQFFDGNLTYLRERVLSNSLDEYYALSGEFIRNFSVAKLPGRFKFSTNLNSSLNVNFNNDISRPPSSAQLGIGYKQKNLFGPIKFSSELFGNLNSFVNSADADTTNEELSVQYGLLASITAPQIKKGDRKVSFLSPKISLSFNGQENDILGDYFIGADELTWGNIHSVKKITSLTESEKGFSLSAGVDRQVFWETGQRLTISLAASKISSLSYNPASTVGLIGEKYNYLAKVSYQTNTGDVFSTNTLLSSNGKVIRGDIRGKYIYKKFALNGEYEFIDRATDKRLSRNLNTIKFLSSYSLSNDLIINFGSRYDLTSSQTSEIDFGFGFSLGSWEYKINQEYLNEEKEKLIFQ